MVIETFSPSFLTESLSAPVSIVTREPLLVIWSLPVSAMIVTSEH